MDLIRSLRLWRARLELDRDEYGRATMVKTFRAYTKAEATELARLELGLSPLEAARKLTVEEL